jgi:hypothetical protein
MTSSRTPTITVGQCASRRPTTASSSSTSQTKTIIDVNSYTSLLSYHADFLMRRERPKDFVYKQVSEDDKKQERWFAKQQASWPIRWTEEHGDPFRAFVEAGFDVIRQNWRDGSAVVIPNNKIYEMVEHDAKLNDMAIVYTIDVKPWRYYCGDAMGAPERKEALRLAREIGFPFTRKEGLNRIAPPPPTRKKSTTQREIKARYIWMKMKEGEHKEFDGVPWERLAKETKEAILKAADDMSDAEYDRYQVGDFIRATSRMVVISGDNAAQGTN